VTAKAQRALNRSRAADGKGLPGQDFDQLSSYVERQNLTLRMTQKRFARLTNGFSKKLTNHAAAVSLYVAHYNLCRVHEALRTTPAVAIGVADRVWTIGDLIDAVLPLEPNRPVRVKRNFRVIEGGKA
jgi:hypothetical protein